MAALIAIARRYVQIQNIAHQTDTDGVQQNGWRPFPGTFWCPPQPAQRVTHSEFISLSPISLLPSPTLGSVVWLNADGRRDTLLFWGMAQPRHVSQLNEKGGGTSMNDTHDGTACVVCTLDRVRFALPLASVEKVVRLVEIAPVPQAPPEILGLIDVQGEVVTVFDLRPRFGLPGKEPALSDRLVITRSGNRPIAILVDAVEHVTNLPPGSGAAVTSLPAHIGHVKSVIKLGDGLVLVFDLAAFLALDPQLVAQIAAGQIHPTPDQEV